MGMPASVATSSSMPFNVAEATAPSEMTRENYKTEGKEEKMRTAEKQMQARVSVDRD
jgi:predicted aconitase